MTIRDKSRIRKHRVAYDPSHCIRGDMYFLLAVDHDEASGKDESIVVLVDD